VTGRKIGDEELHRLIDEKAEAFQHCISAGVEPYPGVLSLVKEISGNLPLAICSGALPGDILPILAGLGIADAFNVMVTAVDVPASKPDPASYMLAVARLREKFPERKISPEDCLAIEDTPAGIASAVGAKLKVIGVTNSYPEESLMHAFKIVPTLAGITLEGLRRLF
jgi:beta-phosphoglucomutase